MSLVQLTMSDIDNGQTPAKAPGTSVYHELPLQDVDETESRPVRPLLHHQSSSLSHSYPESTFSSQSTEYGSTYGQDFGKGTGPSPEGMPKKVLQTGWLLFLQSWLFHAPSVILTVVVGYIGSAQLFWFPEEGPVIGNTKFTPSTISNLLQIAAKLHEIVMVLSISAVILAIYRRRLIGNGIRLGCLTAGYRVGDVGYLFSSPFWRQGLERTRSWEILLCGLFVFATIMSATVGPASAVLLLPSLDWFDFAAGTAFSNTVSPLTYDLDRNHVWEPVMRIGENYTQEDDVCLTPEGLYGVYCPTSGFREMNEWVRQWRATNLASPILYQAVASDIGRRLKPLTDKETSVVLSTTPSDFLLNSIGLFQNYIAAANVGAVSGRPGSGKLRYRLQTQGADIQGNPFSAALFQPFVQSKCHIFKKAEFLAMDTVPFPTKGLKCMKDRVCERASESPPLLQPQISPFNKGTVGSGVTNFFVEFDNSTVVYLSGQTSMRKEDQGEDNIYLCSLVASWIPANYTFDPVKSNVLKSTLWSDKSMRGVGVNDSATGTMLKFTNMWLRRLNPWIDLTEGNEWSALEAITSYFKQITETTEHAADAHSAPPGGSDDNAAKEVFLATAIGVYLTEALARSSGDGNTVVKLSKNDTILQFANLDSQGQKPVSNITVHNATHVYSDDTGMYTLGDLDTADQVLFQRALPIVLTAERYGYGTGQPRKSLHFAQAMLAMYLGAVSLYAAAIAAGHVLDICRDGVRGRRRILHVAAWSDLQDLLLLALKTPVPVGGDLADAGAGATSSSVWKKIVQVRADDRDHVQLVMDYDAQGTTRTLGMTGKEKYY